MERIGKMESLDLNCTIVGATGSAARGGTPFIASTSDDPYSTRTRVVAVEPGDGYRFVATQIVTLPGYQPVEFHHMHTRGVNEKGFAYVWSGAPPNTQYEPDYSGAYGIPFEQFGRMLLSRAGSVAEGIDLLESIPRSFHGNFLFADAGGEVALIEVSTQSMYVETRTRDGWLARSNHWVSEEMAYKGRSSGGQSSSEVRLKRATELMGNGEGRIDVAYLSDLYRDHETLAETGWSICAHGHTKSPDGERHGTVSSEILEPASRTLSYCYGWPCGEPVGYPGEQDYQEYSWGQYLPFSLDKLEPGEYVTAEGRLTPLAVRYLAKNGKNDHSG